MSWQRVFTWFPVMSFDGRLLWLCWAMRIKKETRYQDDTYEEYIWQAYEYAASEEDITEFNNTCLNYEALQ